MRTRPKLTVALLAIAGLALVFWPVTAVILGLVVALGALPLPLVGIVLWLPWIGPKSYGLWHRMPLLGRVSRAAAGGIAIAACIPLFILGGDILSAGVNGVNAWSTASPTPAAVAVATSSITTAPAVLPVVPPITTSTLTPTPTLAATPTQPPAATPPPTARPPTPAPPPTPLHFGAGTWVVGKDISAGTYRIRTVRQGCYWARLLGFSGSLGDIISNDNTNGPTVVTIAATDAGFQSTRCGDWSQDPTPVTASPADPFGSGTYIVGLDIAPGTWRAQPTSSCYWARLSGFSGELGEILANDNTSESTIVTIAPTDKGFTSTRCGTWTKG